MRIALTLAAAMVIAAPATAKVYIATYTGTVTGGPQTAYDVSGVFGTPYTALGGLAYRAVFRIDDALPGAPIYIGPEGPYRDISVLLGGVGYGTTAVPVTATLTINGVTATVDGDVYSVAKQTHHNFDQTIHYVQGRYGASSQTGNNYVYQLATLFEPREFLTSADLRTALNVDLTGFAAGDAGGSFSIYQPNATNGFGYDYALGALHAEHLTIAAAVPEPATWSLLIAGFGLTGAALRRRARVVRA